MTGLTGGAERTRGFTLVELLVALAIAGIVVVTVHRLFAAAIGQSRRLTVARAELDRRENASRWLAEAIASIDVGRTEPGPFIGTRSGIEFSAWLLTAYGWHEADRVTVQQDGSRLVARLRSGREIVLADSVAAAEFDYLVEQGEAAPWLKSWSSAVNAPLAIRVRLYRVPGPLSAGERADTTVVVVGSRG